MASVVNWLGLQSNVSVWCLGEICFGLDFVAEMRGLSRGPLDVCSYSAKPLTWIALYLERKGFVALCFWIRARPTRTKTSTKVRPKLLANAKATINDKRGRARPRCCR
jgi:hypothetical protein